VLTFSATYMLILKSAEPLTTEKSGIWWGKWRIQTTEGKENRILIPNNLQFPLSFFFFLHPLNPPENHPRSFRSERKALTFMI